MRRPAPSAFVLIVGMCGAAGASPSAASQQPSAADRAITSPIRRQIIAPTAATSDVKATRRTLAETLDFCLTNSDKRALSAHHITDGWERHFNADRLQTTASTFKTLVLIGYAEAVADGRVAPHGAPGGRAINPDKLMTLSGATTVSVADKFLLGVVDPNGKLKENVENNNVAYQRIR